MHHFVAYCLRGLEGLLKDELNFHGFPTVSLHPGCVIFSVAQLESIPFLNQHIRIAEHIDLLFFWGKVPSCLEAIEELLTAIDYSPYFDPKLSFAVRANRQGCHPFGSMDLMQAAARALTRAMRRQGYNVFANLKQPEQYYRANIYEDFLTFGLSTNGQALSQRYELAFGHEAPLNRTIAAALLWESSFRHHGQLIDPMCGGATILIEAALWRQGRSLELENRIYDYRRHRYYSQMSKNDQGAKAVDYHIPCQLPLIGGERSDRKVLGALQNLENLQLKREALVYKGNARKLTYLKSEAQPLVVTNPPYGIRVMRPSEVDRLYMDFAKALHLAEVQEVVAITPKKRSWLDSFDQAGYHLISTKEIYYGDMPAFIMKHHIDARQQDMANS